MPRPFGPGLLTMKNRIKSPHNTLGADGATIVSRPISAGGFSRRQWLARAAASTALLGGMKHTLADEPTTSETSAPRKRPSVLLYTGWARHNIGDVGHTPGTLRYLTEFLPEARITCWLKVFTPDVVAMLKRRFPNVTIVPGGVISSAGKATSPELQAAFDAADMFIHNSGMDFNRFWQPPTHLPKLCLSHGKQFGIYGQSFDGFRAEDRESLPPLLSKLDFIFCRDNDSLKSLRAAGVTTKVLEFGPDGCFGIDVRDDAAAATFMAKHGLEKRRFLAAILRTDKHVSMNPGDPLEQLAGGPEEWVGKLREVIVEWVRRTGLPVVIVPEVEKEIGPAKQMVFDLLPEDVRGRVIVRDTFWNVDEAVSFYAQAHTLVSMEPHSCIMALAVGTPMIHMFTMHHGYKAWMFRDIGLPEWLVCMDDEPATRVTAALDRIHDHYDMALAKTKRAMQFVNARSAEVMGDIRRILEKRS